MRKNGFDPRDNEMSQAFKRLMEDVLFEKRLKVTEASRKTGIPTEALYKYLNPNSWNNLPAFWIPIWTKQIGPELLMWLAKEAGYAVAKLPDDENISHIDAVKAAAKAMKECSEALETYSKAIEDGKITLLELKNIKKEVTEALSALLFLEKVSEAMRAEAKLKELEGK